MIIKPAEKSCMFFNLFHTGCFLLSALLLSCATSEINIFYYLLMEKTELEQLLKGCFEDVGVICPLKLLTVPRS